MEEEHIVGAHGANNATKPKLKRKRRRSAIEVVDLTEAATAAPSSRHLPRLRVSPPKQNQPDPNVKHSASQDSPIFLDVEPSSSKPAARHSQRRANAAAATTANVQQQPVSPRRSSLRTTALPTARRSRWGEIQDPNPPEQATNNGGSGDGDSFLARRLAAEEELLAARQRRALEYHMQELEHAEAELERAATVQQQQLQQQQQQQRGRSYNNYSRHLFSNSSGRSYASNSAAQYEGNPPSTVNRRRKRRGGAGGNNAAADPSSAAGAMFGGVPGVPPPPPSGPRSGRGGSLSGFSDPMAEFFLREAEAEAEWHRQQQLEGFPHEVEDEEERALDELMIEAAFRGRMTSRMSTGGPPSRRRGGGGSGRGPRERGGGRGGGHFSSILTELAALHQAVMGARSSALPSELLFSDRDFTEADYEALLALDEGVENRKGAKQDVINQLHSERVPRGHGGQAVAAAYGDCCICLEKIGAGQTIRKLECSHHFHKGCVDKWLKQKASCPICQRRIGIDIE